MKLSDPGRFHRRISAQPKPGDAPGLRKLLRQGRNSYLIPMAELDAMIAAGWGHVPRVNIPPDFRTRPPWRRRSYV